MALEVVKEATPSDRILNACRRLVNLVHKASISTEKSIGISVAQHFLLQKLTDGKARSVGELANITHTHQSSVSSVVKKLIDKDLVESVVSTEDARRRDVRLSPKGEALLRSAQAPKVQDQLLNAAGRLSQVERNALAELLERYLSEMELGEAPPSMFLED